MSTSLYSTFASLVYVLAVTRWGPRLMAHRQPPKGLQNVIVLFNAGQVGVVGGSRRQGV